MSDTAITPSSNGKIKIKTTPNHPKPQRFKAFSYVLSNALPAYCAFLLPALHAVPACVPVLTPGQKSITSDVVQRALGTERGRISATYSQLDK